ncbi:hypothetical protein [Jatrophihabitans fulvus]
MLTGTLLAGTRLPLSTWVAAAAMPADLGTSELARRLGVTTEAARRVRATRRRVEAPPGAPADAVLRALLAVVEIPVASRRRLPDASRTPPTGPSADYR